MSNEGLISVIKEEMLQVSKEDKDLGEKWTKHRHIRPMNKLKFSLRFREMPLKVTT